MIRMLEESDRGKVIMLLRRAEAFNLYALGNLNAHGFSTEFCQFWGDIDAQGALRAVLNRYMSGWVIFGLPDADWRNLGAVIDNHAIQAERLQDNPDGIDSFLPYLSRYHANKVENDELATLEPGLFRPIPPGRGVHIRRATLPDLPELITFYAKAGDMSRVPAAIERPLCERRIWVAVWQDEIASAALTNAETDDLAMIGGVFTKFDARGQKLSQSVVSALCSELIEIGKKPVLYWHNPVAGAIYHKIGFQSVGSWRSVRLQKSV